MLFHRTQAEALGELEENTPEEAIQAINRGLDTLREFFVKHEAQGVPESSLQLNLQ